MAGTNKVEIIGVMLARSLQAIRSSGGTLGYYPEIVEGLKARYSFLSAPKEHEILLEPPKGIELKHGKFVYRDQVVIIDKFTLFNDGVAADTTSSTDDSGYFLDDLMEWAKSAMPKAQISRPRYYLSHIEFKMSEPLEGYTPRLKPVGEQLTALLKSYGIAVPRYEATAIHLRFDQIGKINPQPGVFFIDRRAGIPFSENIWFSQAPLRTKDHIALLEDLG